MPSLFSYKKRRIDGRMGWVLQSDRLQLELLEGGGHIASITMPGRPAPLGVNPLWKPHWRSMEPHRFVMSRDGARFGNNPESRLLSGIRGHNLCFDYWSAPSAEEVRAGLSFHGEAGVVRWREAGARITRTYLGFSCGADLPLSAAHIGRRIWLRPGETVAYIEETATNLTGLDRPAGWVEHVTIGPPFLRRGETIVDMSGADGCSLPGALGRVPAETEFMWPFVSGPDGRGVDLRVAAPEIRSGFDLAVLVEPSREFGFVAAATPRLKLLLAYVFRRTDFPWINVWEQNRQAETRPWNGRTLALGMEFGNTIVPGSRRAMAAFRPEVYGTPTYGWLSASGSKTVRYLAFLAEIPRDYRGTDDIQLGPDRATIVERDHAREFHVACDPAFLSA